MDTLLQKIRDLRVSRGWTEYRLAEESGVSQSTISAWYNEKKSLLPTTPSLRKIAAALGVNPSYLLAEDCMVELTDQQKHLLDKWEKLDEECQSVIFHMIDVFIKLNSDNS